MPAFVLPTFPIHCPKCSKVVGKQPISVMKYIVPKFVCVHCNELSRLVANRPAGVA